MKVIFLAIASALLGLIAAAAWSYNSHGDPGPDFQWIVSDVPGYQAYESPRPEERPQQQVEVLGGEEHDFGVMDRGETREHDFVVINNTDEAIELSEGPSTCKCTIHTLERNVLQPGEQCSIKLEWTAKSLETEFRQSATINTTSRHRPKIMLSVFGKVLQIVQPFPRDVTFSDVVSREAREGQFTLFGFKDDSLDIVEHRWVYPETADYFEFEYAPAPQERLQEFEGARAALDCKVRMKAGMPLGPVRQLLEVVTSSARSGALDIPIRGRIVGDITLKGRGYLEKSNLLNIGPVKQDSGFRQKLFVTVKGEHAPSFHIEKTVSVPEGVFEVTVAEPKELRGGTVRIVSGGTCNSCWYQACELLRRG